MFPAVGTPRNRLDLIGPARGRVDFDTFAEVPNMDLIVNRFPDYMESDYHDHEFIEIAYVQAGHGWHVLDKEIMLCGPGDVYVIDHGEAHMFMAELNTPLTICNLIFYPDFFDVSLRGRESLSDLVRHQLRSFRPEDYPGSLSVSFQGAELQEINHLYENLLGEYARHEPGFEELIRAWSLELLVRIFRKASAVGVRRGRPLEVHMETLNAVFDYIQQHYTESISLDALAAIAYLSPKYFSSLFKRCTGQTVTEYIQKLRVSHACDLLAGTGQSVAQIAATIGYGDVKFFGRVFHRGMGVSPSEYRRQAQQRERGAGRGKRAG